MKTLWPRLISSERAKIDWLGRQIHLVVPSVVEPGEPFRVRISAVGPDHLPLTEEIILRFRTGKEWEGIPERVTIQAQGVTLEGVKISKPGSHYLTAELDIQGCAWSIFSNPMWACNDPPFRLFWGDLHVHSIHGGCQPYVAKSPRFAMAYARSVTFLDFLTITDHNDRLTSETWAEQKSLVKEYDRPGLFVPFLGFESSHASGQGGDNNVYFKEFEGDFFPREENAQNKPVEDLWQFLKALPYEFMTIPHHTGRQGKYRSWDEPRYNPHHEMLYEIYSMWGSSECHPSRYPLWGGNTYKKAYFQDALVRGCRFGVIASGDDHTSMPGSESPLRLPGRPVYSTYPHHGLVGVFAERLDRESLWSAFRARRTVAATYGRPLLLFEAENATAGAEIPAVGKRHVRVHYIPAFPERQNVRLTIFRNQRPCFETSDIVTGEYRTWSFQDDAPLDKILIREAPFADRPFVAYYARLDTDLGGTAWSSPIWFVQ